MAPNGNAVAIWAMPAPCVVDGQTIASVCSVMVGAVYSVLNNLWEPAQIVTGSTQLSSEFSLRINSRGDVAVKYVGLGTDLNFGTVPKHAIAWRSSVSVATNFQQQIYGLALETGDYRWLGLDESGGLNLAQEATLGAYGGGIYAYRGHVNTGPGGPERIVDGYRISHFATGSAGRTVIAYLPYDTNSNLFYAASTDESGSGAWAKVGLTLKSAYPFSLQNHFYDFRSFASVDDLGNARIQSIYCKSFRLYGSQWSDEPNDPLRCTSPIGVDGGAQAYDRNGNYILVQSGPDGPALWVSYDGKRNRMIHGADTNASNPVDLVFGFRPTLTDWSKPKWDRTKWALSINGTAVFVARAALDTLPTVSQPTGISRDCGGGVPCIFNLWAFSLQ
jgi:hypothetical protein